MTVKPKKTKCRLSQARIARLHSSIEDDLFWLAGGETHAEPRWNRPRKERISLRVDCEVVDWFKSKGPGYQTRINRILRRVMTEGKKRNCSPQAKSGLEWATRGELTRAVRSQFFAAENSSARSN